MLPRFDYLVSVISIQGQEWIDSLPLAHQPVEVRVTLEEFTEAMQECRAEQGTRPFTDEELEYDFAGFIDEELKRQLKAHTTRGKIGIPADLIRN